MRSPSLLLIRMNAAETSASSAMADCTPLAVVSRSSTTAEIDTFMSDVSTTSTNIAIDSRMASFGLLPPETTSSGMGGVVTSDVVPSWVSDPGSWSGVAGVVGSSPCGWGTV